jgi:hypothetical protein
MGRFDFQLFRLSTDAYQDYQCPQDAAGAITIHDSGLRPRRFDNGTRCHKNVIVNGGE